MALNKYLNAETRRSQANSRTAIEYKHLREKDSFFEVPEPFLNSLPPVIQEIRSRYPRHTPRIRITTNQRTGEVEARIMKFRVADLQISCPRNNFDVRISVSVEVKCPETLTGTRLVEYRERGQPQGRIKDRLSYKHQSISVDLTQVTSESDGSKVHELELEMDTWTLVEQAKLAQSGAPNDYEEIVGLFMNDVRVLNRACGSGWLDQAAA
jgi:mRNA capping family enzyme